MSIDWGYISEPAADIAVAGVDAADSSWGSSFGFVSDLGESYVADAAGQVDSVWSWVGGVATDTIDTVSNWIGDTWDWVNDQIDTYVWDADSDVAVLEGWAKDVASTIADAAGIAWDGVIDWISDLLFDPETGVVEDVEKVVDEVVKLVQDPLVYYRELEEKIRELSLDALGGILLGIVDVIGARLEAWITNALGLVALPKPPEEKEE